jgi:hypothetical protein
MTIRINRDTWSLIFNGIEIPSCGIRTMYKYEDCAEISLPALRRAIAELEGKKIPPMKSTPRRDGPVDMSDSNGAPLLEGVTGNFVFCSDEETWPEFITLDVSNEGDLIATFFVPCEEANSRSILEKVSPHLRFQGAHLIRYKREENEYQSIPPGWEFDVLLPPRSLPLSAVRKLARTIAETIRHPGAEIGPLAIQDLRHGGAPESIVGLAESEWLEVKSQGYNLDSLADRIELAQDVSRFANSEEGGILVIGYRTKKNRHGEVVSKLTPIKENFAQVNRYRSVIDARVFPPIDGLGVRSSRHGAGWILSILVPPQNEENKPFLVHGAIVDGKIEGAFISIVRRRGEASIPITGPAIHSMLAAGRRLLHGRSQQK